MYSLIAPAYAEKYGVDLYELKEVLARISWKNHHTAKAGTELKIHVASQSDSAVGSARLHIRELPVIEAAQEAKLTLDAAFEEAQRLAREQKLLEARELLEPEARALLESAGVEHHAGAHLVLWRVGAALDSWGDTATSLTIFEALARFGEDLYPPQSRARLQVLASMCGTLGQLGRSEEAMPYCEQALRISEHSFGVRSAEAATVRFNLGLAQFSAHKLEAARDSIQSALDDFARTLGPEHVNTGQAQSTLGAVLNGLGELDEARRVQERSIEVLRKALDETDYRLLAAQTNLAATLSGLGDDRAARATHEAILAVYLRLHEPDSLDVLRARHNVAICRMRAKELQEACAEFEALSAVYRRLGLIAGTDAELSEVARGSTYNKLGRFQDALHMVEERRALPARQIPAGDWRIHWISRVTEGGRVEAHKIL
jgi:tetratricopeptide (TPR) repeat protein